MIRKIVSMLLLSAAFSGCFYDKEELLYPTAKDCSTVDAHFAAQVQPLIQTRCAIAGCHDAASGNVGGPFTNYTQIKNKAGSIKTQVTSGAMPQGSTLTVEQIQLISCWVDSGAPNN